MASAADSDSETDEPKAKKLSFSCQKILESSSDEDAAMEINKTPISVEAGSSGRRKSQRKRRKSFEMPSKEKQWSALGEATSHVERLSTLKPRKLVNDFTKITHRYNYDYAEVSGEESMEEFIKNTDSSDSASDTDNSGKDTKCFKTHRVKGLRSRVSTLSDSSDDDSSTNTPTKVSSKTSQQRDLSVNATQITEASNVDLNANTASSSRLLPDDSNSDTEPTELSDTVGQTSRKQSSKRRKASVLSDSDEKSSESESESQKINLSGRKKSKLVLDSGSESDEPSNSQEADAVVEKSDEIHLVKQETGSISGCETLASSDKIKTEPATPQTKCSNVKLEIQSSDTGFSGENDGSSSSSTYYSSSSKSEQNDQSSSDDDSRDDDSSTDNSDDDDDDEDSESDSSGDRIEKLAAQKKERRENMFSGLLAARAKHKRISTDSSKVEVKEEK